MTIVFLLLATFILVNLQIYLYQKWAFAHVFYTRHIEDKPIFAGEIVLYKEEIVNKKLLPLPWIRVHSFIPKELVLHSETVNQTDHYNGVESIFSLSPYQKIKRSYEVSCPNRGYFKLDKSSLKTGDFLGFHTAYKGIETPLTIIVYPKLIDLSTMTYPSSSLQGHILVKRWVVDDPFINAGVREYASHDSMKRINWNASARTGDLKVNKNDYSADYQLMIYINFDENKKNWSRERYNQLMEKAISYAATLATVAINNGLEVGFGCNAHTIETVDQLDQTKVNRIHTIAKANRSHLHALYTKLAMLVRKKMMNFNDFYK
ncbi:hypothetical protein JCM19046_2238 [Bacillus sp. JCM 19046]|nr:hypothetical protein JCM19046_2238 [Bacillus sp. JCM 19046]